MGRALCLLLVAACSPFSSSALLIDRVDPSSAPNTTAVPVRIEGTGFHLPITSDLDQGNTVVGSMTVSVGNVALGDAVWRGEQLIEGTVPAGLSEGSYDVTVTIGDRNDVLVGGYTVTGVGTGVDAGSVVGVDAGVDAAPDAIPCTPGYLDLCSVPLPTTTLALTGAATINTDTDPRCQTVTAANGRSVCLVYATAVSISGGGGLVVTGSRPLAIASTSTMSISGTIDVSSQRATGQIGPSADDASCAFAAIPEPDLGGAGGAAGGSFGAIGGDGGTGDTDNSLGGDGTALPGLAGPAAAPSALRGGCPGQLGANESAGGGAGGAGGHSGGALYLFAKTSLTVPGKIRATGAGGVGGQPRAAGGGGGTGGLVVIESPSIMVPGQISANGGGGAEGGATVGVTPFNGLPGADGAYGTTPAPGGKSTNTGFGYGGAGGAGTTAATAGTASTAAGGGGGGGVGIIKLLGTNVSVSGTVSPPPS